MQQHDDEHTEAAVRYGRRMARWVVLGCELFIIAAWVLQQLSNNGWWGAVATALIPPALWLIPAAIAVGAAVAGRDRFSIAAALVLIPVVVFGLMGAQWHLRNTQRPAPDTIIIATWNLGNQHRQAAAVRGIISQTGADVCLMQEAFDKRFRSQFTGWQCRREKTQRICVTHPPDSGSQLSDIQSVPVEGSIEEALSATVQTQNGSFQVFNVHISRHCRDDVQTSLTGIGQRVRKSHRSRRIQIESVARWARNTDGPFVIAGDFNTPPAENIFGPLRAVASDTFVQAGQGLGYTFPAPLPLYRIDGIWVSRHFRVLCAGVVDRTISDHRPVWAELQIVTKDIGPRGQ